MSALEALIFDVDGTLADTERDGHRVAFNEAFREAGLNWYWDVDLYGELLSVTGGKERIRHYANHYLSEFQADGPIDQFAANLHQRKTQYYLEMLQSGAIPLRPGVERLLNQARDAGLRLAIATTTTPENVTYLLSSTLGKSAISWFEVIAAGDIVAAKKPAPDIYLWALDKMQLAPKKCMAFEDSYNGLQSSLAADLTTVVAINDYTRQDDFTGAALVIDQYGEKNRPFNILQGELPGMNPGILSIDLIRKLHARYTDKP